MNRRFLVAGIIIAVVVIIGIGSSVAISRVPQISDQVSQGTSSVHVNLLVPENSGAWPLDSYIPVLVSAEGNQPVQSLELYINGVLYDTKTAPQGWAGNFLPHTGTGSPAAPVCSRWWRMERMHQVKRVFPVRWSLLRKNLPVLALPSRPSQVIPFKDCPRKITYRFPIFKMQSRAEIPPSLWEPGLQIFSSPIPPQPFRIR